MGYQTRPKIAELNFEENIHDKNDSSNPNGVLTFLLGARADADKDESGEGWQEYKEQPKEYWKAERESHQRAHEREREAAKNRHEYWREARKARAGLEREERKHYEEVERYPPIRTLGLICLYGYHLR